jgi:hypothetical protein
VDAFLQKVLVDSNHQLLVDAHGPHLHVLIHSMEASVGKNLTNSFMMWLKAASSSIDALMDLMATCRQAVLSSNNAPPNVNATSANGIYLRSVCIGFEELSFDSLGLLWTDFSQQIEAVLANDLENASSSSWQLSSAQMENALQQEIRDISLRTNNSNLDRNMQLEEIIQDHPELPSAHFLHFLHSLQAGDRQAAVDALHHYLDLVLLQVENNHNSAATDDEHNTQDSEILQFASILSAAMYDSFGDRALSLTATEEAVRVAQQSQDAACVAFALGWLGIHGREESALGYDRYRKLASQELIQRCVQRGTETNLRSLTAGAALTLAVRTDDRPSDAWTHLLRASTDDITTDASSGLDRPTLMNHLECGEEALGILARQRLVSAGFWGAFGQPTMSKMNAKVMLQCHSDQLMSQDITIAVQNIARSALCGSSTDEVGNDLHRALQTLLESEQADKGNGDDCIYAEALLKLMSYRNLFNLPIEGMFRLEMILILHEWAIRRGEYVDAEDLDMALRSHMCPRIPSYEEIKLDCLSQRCLLLSRLKKWDEAKTLADGLVAQCKKDGRANRHARSLILMASIYLEASPDEFTGALPLILECSALSDKPHMKGVHACALVLLGEVHLRMRNPERGIAVVRAALPTLLQNEHVSIQGEAHLTLGKCYLQLAGKPTSASSLDSLRAGIYDLQMSSERFRRCQDCHRLKEVYYLLAIALDKLPGGQTQRDEAAEVFVKLSHHLQNATAPKTQGTLNHLDEAQAFAQLTSRTIPVV